MLGTLAAAAVLALSTGDVELMARDGAGAPLDGDAARPALAGDGSAVAWTSDAASLGAGRIEHVFLRDLGRESTALVSRGADALATDPAVSANGRFVAFQSSSNAVAGGAPDTTDVFVRDVVRGTTALVSRAGGSNGARPADDSSAAPSISADGRLVAFQSDATNLGGGGGEDTVAAVYVRDVVAGTTTLVSRASGVAGAPANEPSGAPAISADGHVVAFHSFASNLAGDAPRGGVFVRDLARPTTKLVSRAGGTAGVAADGQSRDAAISADGRVVAFVSTAGNLAPDARPTANVYVRDLRAGTTILASPGVDRPADEPALSGDGRLVAFSTLTDGLAGDRPGVSDVLVRDLRRGAYALASGGPAGAGDGDSFAPSLSADGRLTAFASEARNLVRDARAEVGVFVRDLGPPAGGGGGDEPAGPYELPIVTLDVRRRQRLRRFVTVTAGCPAADCRIRVRGRARVRARGRSFPMAGVVRRLRAGDRTRVRVRLSWPRLRRLRAARADGARVTGSITLVGTAAGRRAVRRRAILFVR